MASSMDFANILFGGPCNRFCPWCIGKALPQHATVNNLSLFPPRNLDRFIEQVTELGIDQVVFSGTNTDPQLYRHEAELLALLRERLPRHVCYSLHTNGVLALRRMEIFNQYDKACISFPSFNSDSYRKLMGSNEVPELGEIVRRSEIPVKVSCLVNEHNIKELASFLYRCREIGVRRVVLRQLYGQRERWPIFPELTPCSYYRGNPVYDIKGMEVTHWCFDLSESSSINLFPNGTIGSSYRLAETEQFVSKVNATPIESSQGDRC